ncbi:MAG: MSHA biogenesis protein MshE [Gammaproteobacteria bacterium]|nr:MAG: MSHA biogenesis protein MshE [Gammaproteobacteria bacterium]
MSDTTPAAPRRIRLGDLLVAQGAISAEQLQQALAQQRRLGRKLGQTLVALGYIDEDRLLRILAEQLKLPLVDLRQRELDPELVRRLPETVARRHRAVLIEDTPEGYLVGMADPTDLFALDDLARRLNRPVKPAVVREGDLLEVFDRVYRRTDEIQDLAEALGQALSEAGDDLAELLQVTTDEDVPVARLLKSIFEDAVAMRASDIHIEPDEDVLRIRQRVDGVLHEQVMKEKQIAPALVLRLKITAGLDIAEKRLPQDGRFNIRVRGRQIDVRLSTMPVEHGESVVMRLLDQSGGLLDLDGLGMPPDVLAAFRRIIRAPHGLILVTGPTGSGKTTTLYAALQELNEPDKKIITAEDPVEYRLPRINQVQVKPKIGLGFVEILRAALRQDPDIILVGEMRDRETVEIGLRAAMTGHLVLSTLHTNDAVHTADRLLDMGAEGFLIAASLRAVVAQRLVRRVCESCARPVQASERERAWALAVCGVDARDIEQRRGAGCARCNHTGYRGRIGVYELLEPDEAMIDALRAGDALAFAAAARANTRFKPMHHQGLGWVRAGITTIEEIMRISAQRVEDE